jgi:hypothetical protein
VAAGGDRLPVEAKRARSSLPERFAAPELDCDIPVGYRTERERPLPSPPDGLPVLAVPGTHSTTLLCVCVTRGSLARR